MGTGLVGIAETSQAGKVVPYTRRELFAPGKERVFEGEHLGEIAFPLGGIGTGTVSLGGRGNLRDWEIFNRPNKGGTLPFTFVALWVREGGSKPVTRVVEAPLPPPYRGAHGVSRESAEGLPRFRAARFFGSYPLARIEFSDPDLPVDVALEAFNPFIPLEVDDSGLPVAILGYPDNGALTAAPGRIGQTARVLTEDAYGRGPVPRTVTTLRGLVRHGNSGGPAVDSAGRVRATIFATRVGSDGGYGIPKAEITRALSNLHGSVSTGDCVR